MGKEIKFKFVVGNTSKWCSKVWNIKIKRDDVYIMCGSDKYHKISLHSSGVCHSAIAQEHMQRFDLKREERTNVRWISSPDIYESCLAFSILVAFDQMDNRSASFSFPDDLLKIPPPPVSSAVHVQFIKTNSCGKEIKWHLDPGIHLLHSVQLKSGDTLSIIYYNTNSFNPLIEQCKSYLASFATQIQPLTSHKLTSGFITAFDNSNKPYHIELKL